MRAARPVWNWAGACSAVLASWSCAAGPQPSLRWQVHGSPLAASSIDDSMLCHSLADHFVGLPTVDSRWTKATASGAPAPSAGRWWVRQCSAQSHGADLNVALRGPGWYWVDQRASGIRVRQQVPFDLSLSVRGRLRKGATDGVFSLWFVPSAEPIVEVEAPAELEAEPVNAWGNLLSLVPGVSPTRAAARRFRQDLTRSLLLQAHAGVTVTYDLRTGQADTSLGQLAPGTAPRPALGDEPTWAVNERLLLAPGGVQVLGPIDPGPLTLNVVVEQGPGLTYRAACQQALSDNYQVIRDGNFSRLPPSTWLVDGRATGLGERTARLRVEACRFFLIVTTSSGDYTVGAVRVRE